MIAKVEAKMDQYLGNGGSGTPITSIINSTNAADHIGEYIDLGTNLIEKTGTTHKADWRIFDADETGVYAILADYLPNTTIGFPDKMKVSEAEDAKEVSIVKNANSWTLGWKSTGDGSCADRSEAIGTLITPSNWDFVVPISSPLRGHVTGAPTYPQFAKSWNKANFLGHSLKVCCKLVSYIV